MLMMKDQTSKSAGTLVIERNIPKSQTIGQNKILITVFVQCTAAAHRFCFNFTRTCGLENTIKDDQG